MTKKLRIMNSSNAIWAQSGYSMQAVQYVPAMAKAGYPTAMVNFYGQEGGDFMYKGVKMYSKMNSTWGEDAALHHGLDFKADVILTLQDIWTLNPQILSDMSRKGLRWIPIIPIDHEPVPLPTYDRLKLAYRIVTISEFGYEELKKVGMHSTYIPHTIETELFKPISSEEKKIIRKKANLPEDAFLFGMVAANKDNPPRKSFQEVLDAFKMFLQKRNNAYIYFHTIHNQQNGFQILQYAKFIGVDSHIITCDPHDYLYRIKHEDMPNIYNSFDCLLAPSRNEGFGVPIIEAQSCGVPVITTNFTAQKTLVKDGETGFLVDIAYKHYSNLGAYVGIPSVQDLYEKMEAIYKADRVKMGKAARKHVQNNYDFNLVWRTKWLPFLDKLEKEIYIWQDILLVT